MENVSDMCEAQITSTPLHNSKLVLGAVLSLFDGMSCGQQALERCGFIVENYFASEIDKPAISVTMDNYSNTKQLGSVTQVDGYMLPKIDLLIGGSPCQSFSFAGKRKGMSTKCETEILTLEHYLELKAEGYEFEGQSYLFWEYMRLLNEVKPKYFLLENVIMGEKWERILSKAIGVNPIEINSALVSAQNRRRLYWTNIGMKPMGLFGDLESIIKQPKDKGILLKDILENDVAEKYYLSQQRIESMSKSEKGDTGNTNAIEVRALDFRKDEGFRDKGDKTGTLCARARTDESCGQLVEFLEPRNDGKIMQLNTSTKSGGKQQDRIYDTNGISPALMAQMSCGTHAIKHERKIRRLTPLECERLQTVKDGYTKIASDSQRYKMIGNGWTVDVIAHILSYIQ